MKMMKLLVMLLSLGKPIEIDIVRIKPLVVEFWESHSFDMSNRKHVLQHHLIFKGEYVDHAKPVVEIKEVAIFEEF